MNYENYDTFLTEAKKEKQTFDQKKLVSKAMKWLKMRFPKKDYGFSFVHKPNVTNITKTYSVTVDGEAFDIEGRIFDANGSGKEDRGDIVYFKIVSAEELPDEEDRAF